ncbi:hypothetical protein AAL_03240 [Moelleriella libera RCEF 2490]|uniref:Early meiotic induction protein 1 n=1 Tax=Moelleriella libera RCEF 2490 TaxID=1081109 RepID=A0A162IUU5_9HYPO|nr:hypothetical protein AAL_03240 [Moelleriella libera RCEF 2490]
MGWLWSTTPPSPRADRAEGSTGLPPHVPRTEQSSAPNEPVDPEIQKFFDLFRQEPEQPQPSSRPSAPPQAAVASSVTSTAESSSSIASWLALKASAKSVSSTSDEQNAPIGDALSESLLPTDMSCRQAFDLAWACNGLGGQFNSVYRYGNMRSCSEHWDDFWFCMRTRAYTGDMKANMVRTHYRNKAYRKYGEGKPSSEDIWQSRKERLPPGSTFNMPADEAEVSDEEWRRAEEARRRKIRQGLGFDG